MQVVITPIYLALAAVIGLLVGLLVSSLFASREGKHPEGETAPNDLAKDGFDEEVRLWYSPNGKQVITQMDGDFYRDYLTLSPEQKNKVQKLITSWADWSEQSVASKTEITSDQPIEPNTSEMEETSIPQTALDWSVNEALKDEPKAVIDPPKTIAGQISLIIEGMIADSPFKEKGIRLMENNHQGVDVWVGMEKFDGIDAIPYPEVQEIIHKAVVLWEKQSTK